MNKSSQRPPAKILLAPFDPTITRIAPLSHTDGKTERVERKMGRESQLHKHYVRGSIMPTEVIPALGSKIPCSSSRRNNGEIGGVRKLTRLKG